MKIIRTVTVPQSISFFEETMMEMKRIGYEFVVVTSPGKELDSFRKKYPDEATIEVPMERQISLIRDMRALWQMMRVMRKEKPYIVHSMTPKAGLITMMAAWMARVPIRIHTFTGLVWPTKTGLKRTILMATDWLTCACATHVIPEGHGVLCDLKNHGICHKPMQVLGYGNVMGVDMHRFDPSRFTYVKKDINKFNYLYVGRIVGDKGINELIEAFNELNKEYTNTSLTIVGRYEENHDPVAPKTLKFIEDNPCIDVCGPKYGEELLIEYAKADCFVMPSYREGFPNTVLEAGAMGLPSIVTNINGSREIIIQGYNGLVVPAKNAQALKNAMLNLLLNPLETKRMSNNARPLIDERFNKNFVQQCLIEYYKQIVK